MSAANTTVSTLFTIEVSNVPRSPTLWSVMVAWLEVKTAISLRIATISSAIVQGFSSWVYTTLANTRFCGDCPNKI